MNKTLDYYNTFYKNFITDSLEANASDLHHSFLKYLPKGASILDLGCGSGRDSKVFINLGYEVCALDGSKELCKFASEYIGQEVLCKTFEEIDFKEEFDGIWACASLLHISYRDLPNIFKNLSKALKQEGYLYASFKYGEFEGDRKGRYFTDLTEDRLKQLLEPLKEFEIVETTITRDIRKGREEEKWLNIVLRKVVR
ncbi:bifunctional 2-polyprenyl-6-hydroxyphenol methylase/3-demethylubiquinol 3-O-methyltransferase UbiG [Alkalibaculum bacchi]|jgi:SAM-dependent methyltransferase|uniref:class I SAM-dependent methyltransferase n=1 Tax=Alkalibaculum bacchi TaxID=645887 RepID=UPI0026F258DD|nr:class I SAM-dependent methyltransferase [Alkalibaculum bacchi]